MPVRDPKDDPEHIPVEKRLSGDFGSPIEVLADRGLSHAQKREILLVWLDDLEAQPNSPDSQGVRTSIVDALSSLHREE
ncbi:MAG: hypothetical protein AB7L90_09345 [Hyphomicrobiaceae bacterium]